MSRSMRPLDGGSIRSARQRSNSALADVILAWLLRQHLLNKPGDELAGIMDGCLAKAQKLTNLSAVVFGRAARPLVARIPIGRYVDLVGDVDDDNTGNLM